MLPRPFQRSQPLVNASLVLAARPFAQQLFCLAFFALACSDGARSSTASGDDSSLSSTGGTANSTTSAATIGAVNAGSAQTAAQSSNDVTGGMSTSTVATTSGGSVSTGALSSSGTTQGGLGGAGATSAAVGGATTGEAGAGGTGGLGMGGAGVTGETASTGGNPDTVRSAGCGKTSTITFEPVPGESGENVGFGEGGYVRIGNRGFAMRLPDNYDNDQPYPLIFGFHWNGGSARDVDTGGSNGYVMAHFGLQSLSNNGAIFVAPDGVNAGWGNSGGQDLQLVDDMVELIEENYCVDRTRLFANGFSYGGGMSYAIACARANVFRGVAIYNGAVLSGCEGGTEPIAYWQMAGLTDGICTVDAARPMRDRFVENNGCTAQDPPEPPQPPPYLSQGGHVCTTYSGCSSAHPVRWCVHQSGHGNAIVDGTPDLYNSCATPPQSCSDSCPCTWVPEDVWSFFTSL